MKRKIIWRSVLGFPLGMAIGYSITILISLGWANGDYYPCVPELAAAVGSEIHAVVLQALLSGAMGAGFGACSVIWEIENWGIVKQTGIYFGASSVLMLPAAYLLYWMEHSITGFLSYFGIFALIFIIIWVVQWGTGRAIVKKMNAGLHKARSGENEKG